MKIEARGCSVVVEDDQIVIDRGGKATMVKQAFKLSRQGPSALWEAIQGPNRNFLLAALTSSKELLVALVHSLRDGKGPDIDGGTQSVPERQLVGIVTEALSHNKAAALDAFRQNNDLVRDWLGQHKELFGIFLEGDIHIFRKDIVSVENDVRWRKGVFSIHVAGVDDPVKVEYDTDNKTQFAELARILETKTAEPAG